MGPTAADILIETMQDWGVEVIFGLPGDGINAIMEALRKRQEQVRFVRVRHEGAAAFMTCGYAKCTGKLGLYLATSGPGGIHHLNGLYDANVGDRPRPCDHRMGSTRSRPPRANDGVTTTTAAQPLRAGSSRRQPPTISPGGAARSRSGPGSARQGMIEMSPFVSSTAYLIWSIRSSPC